MVMRPAGVAYSSGTKGRKDLFVMTTLMNTTPLLSVNLWVTGNITYAYREAINIRKQLSFNKKKRRIILFRGDQCQNVACSWEPNIAGYWFVTLQCKTIHYFIKRSCGCKFVGKGNTRNPSPHVQ